MKKETAIWVFLFPNLAIFTVFVIAPAISTLFLAFTNYNTLSYSGHFVGLENFIHISRQVSGFPQALLRTFIYSALLIPLVFFFSLMLAVITSSDLIVGKNFLRMIFYWPWILSPAIIGISWRWFLDYDVGLINMFLERMGIAPQAWLFDRRLAFLSIIVVGVWNISGYFMVMFNAALTSIPNEVYEAAALDGANRWTRFWKITFPLLKPTAVLVLVLSTILAVRSFEVIYVLTSGGPGTATTLVVQQIYETAFDERKLGLASAMSLVLFGILMLLSIIQFKVVGEEE